MPLRDDLLTPIAGENPSGPDLRYDPIRDEIKEARREEQETPQGVWKTEVKGANWNKVIERAGLAVATRSKDLQLAVWLVEAHVRKEGFAVVQPGFQFLREFVEAFWDTFHPEIEDGDVEERASILSGFATKVEGSLRILPILRGGKSWISYKESITVGVESDATTRELREKREKLIEEGKTSPEEWEAAINATPKAECETLQGVVSSASEALQALGETCDQRFGQDSPSFRPAKLALEDIAGLLRGFINRKGGATVAQAPQPAPPPPPPVQSAPTPIVSAAPVVAAAPPPAATQSVASASLEPLDLADAEARLAAICRFLRQNDTYNIAPFLILRGLRFGQIRYNGPDKVDESMLLDPPPGMRAELKRLYTEQNWDGLLEATERAMALPCGRGWLDIQFYTVKALEAKGEWWAFVADAVRTELRGLISDMPKLLDMSLVDSTPAASAETKKWIEEEVVPVRAIQAQVDQATAAAAPSVPSASLAPPPLLESSEVEPKGDEIFELALADAQRGHIADALARLYRQLESERSGRKRFVRRVQIAHILVAGGQVRVASPFLEELAAEIDTRSLESWEDSAGLAYPLTLLLQCFNGSEGHDADRAKLYARICKLDPMRALSMNPGSV